MHFQAIFLFFHVFSTPFDLVLLAFTTVGTGQHRLIHLLERFLVVLDLLFHRSVPLLSSYISIVMLRACVAPKTIGLDCQKWLKYG